MTASCWFLAWHTFAFKYLCDPPKRRLTFTGEARPIRRNLRRLPLEKQVAMCCMLEDMERRGVIEESKSPWSSPVVLGRKKRALALRRGLKEAERCHKQGLLSTVPDRRHSGRARWSQMVLHCEYEEWLLADGSASERQTEEGVLGERKLWPFTGKSFGLCNALCSDVWAVNEDCLKKPHITINISCA